MSFSQIVVEKLAFIIKEYRLQILEQRSDYLKLGSNYLIIAVSHNQLENSNSLWIAKSEEIDNVEIDNHTLKEFFHSDLKLSQVPMEIFVNNLITFFINEGQSILQGDVKQLNRLLKFSLDISRKNTQDLLDRQTLVNANKAWDSGNYGEFIKLIKQIDKDNLPPSYHLKLKIANQKL